MVQNGLEKKDSEELKVITNEIVKKIISLKLLNIDKIILYGSYARDEADSESDIDIMVLCNNDEQDVRQYEKATRHEINHIGYENDILIQTKVRSKSEFDRWSKVLPFYQNVIEEGVVLYG